MQVEDRGSNFIPKGDTMKTSKLKFKDNNPRKISQEALNKLSESIRRDPEFMALRPMIVDDDGTVIGGNQRLRAIHLLGMDEVPDSWVVRATDLTDEQKRRFVLVDNAPQGMAGDWDIDLLANEWDVPELEELGFDLAELGVVDGLDDMPALPDGDKEPFQQMTFTLHDDQADQVKAALDVAKGMGAFDSPNENSNGNALARVCETFLTQNA